MDRMVKISIGPEVKRALLLLALLPAAASAQQRPVPATAAGSPAQAVKKQLLTVRYPDSPGYVIVLETAPSASFTCKLEPPGPSYPYQRCTASFIGSPTITLRAGYRKAGMPVGFGAGAAFTMIAGKQWEGACAGTTGDTCSPALSGATTVEINFAGPAGVGAIGIAP